MKHRYFIIGFSVIFIICVMLCIILFNSGQGATAEIYSDNVLIQKVDLSTAENPYDIRIGTEDKYNIIHVENGRISVTSATCPDKLCINQRAIDGGKFPIVCLPNKLVIKFIDNNNSNAPDVISR